MKISPLFVSIGLLLSASTAFAQLKEARVTQIVQDVKLLPGAAAERPAAINDPVKADTAVRTGVESRTELTFADLTIARLGANTIFTFDRGSRAIDLGSGAVLLRVPKNSGGARINTAAVTAAITGTTVIAEYNCPSLPKGSRADCPDALYKFITLEGSMRVCKNGSPNECVDLGPGQMLAGRINQPLSDPVDVDVERLIETSLLIQGFPPLPSQDLLEASAREQTRQKVEGQLVDNSNNIFGPGKLYALNDPVPLETIDQRFATNKAPSPSPTPFPSPSPSVTPSPTPNPSPSPSPIPSPSPSVSPSPTPQPTPQKFGTPPVLTSPNLGVIDAGTVIQTDPTVTRNGETGEGRIYRGPTDDGAFSTWAFTATSAFDMASGIDAHFGASANLELAAFKFLLLTLAGDPTIDTSNGGATKLALISVGNLTDDLGGFGPSGGNVIYRFTGLDTLLLATQAGSILLNNGTFLGIDQLYFYARGANSDLILGSGISGTDVGIFQAERDVQINGSTSVANFFSYAGRDFLNGSGQVSAGVIDIRAGNNVNFLLSQFGVGDAFGQSINLFAGNAINVDVRDDQSAFARASFIRLEANTINFFGDPGVEGFYSIFFETDPLILFRAGSGGFQAGNVSFDHFAASNSFDIFSYGDINVYGIIGVDNMTAGGSFLSVDEVITGTLTTGGSVMVNSGSLFALSFVSAGSFIDVASQLSAPLVMAGGDINANLLTVGTVVAPNGVLRIGAGGIHPFLTEEGSMFQHTFTVDSIVSPNGISFSGNEFSGLGGFYGGGRLTINANNLRFDAEIGLGAVDFSGADGVAGGTPTPTGGGGDGGIFTVNAIGTIFVGEQIIATTGLNDGNDGPFFSGAGGHVTLNAGSSIAVNSSIIVSSDDASSGGGAIGLPTRRSASGGMIDLHSDLTSGTAITLGQTSHLLSRLNVEAPGPGGIIRVLTEGGDIIADGEIVADRGTIIISNMPVAANLAPGGGSFISMDGSFAFMQAETISLLSRGDLRLNIGGTVQIYGVTIDLVAQNNITAGSLESTGGKGSPIFVNNSSGNVNITAGGSIAFDRLGASRVNGSRTSGLNLTLDAGTTLAISNSLFLATDSTNLIDGGNILVRSGGNMSFGGFTTLDTRSNGGTTNGGSILLLSGGTLTGGGFSASASVANGHVDSGANITLQSVGAADFTASQFNSGVFLRLDLFNGGSIGTGGNIMGMFGGNFSAFSLRTTISGLSGIENGGNIDFNVTGNLTTTGGGALFSSTVQESDGPLGPNGGPVSPFINVRAANFSIGSTDFGGDLVAFINDSTSFGPPSGSLGSVTVTAAGTINVFGSLSVLGTVNAAGAINAEQISSTNVFSTALIAAGSSGIQQFGVTQFGRPVSLLHTLTAPVITSTGGISFDGTDAEGDFSTATSGGSLTLNADSLSFGSLANIDGSVSLNGGNGSGVTGFEGANGGMLTVNTTNAITVSGDIEATTGRNPSSAAPSGTGGTVTLNSTAGTVSVNSRIEVSSADQAMPSPTPRRRSNSGGNININSGKSGTVQNRAVAVNIGSSSQLLALLDAAATGPGGKITIVATGANSDVNVDGNAEATRGTIDVRHQGDGGQINIGALTSAPGGAPVGNRISTMSADVIKAGAFGANGQLNVGNSTLSADTLIRLYATGSNGELNFVANTTLSAGTRIDLAANTITIQPSVVVNITGNGGAANVFTNNANYSGFGGTNPNNGTFGGNGANAPQPLNVAPGFDTPPALPNSSSH